jgi:glycosyltransferase involved in cell wall biosynthesis
LLPAAPSTQNIDGRKIKIAFVSVYDAACGIATYNEKLLSELSKYVDVKVFAEFIDNDKTIKEEIKNGIAIVRCWDRKEYPKNTLLKLIQSYGPDLVHFSHEYGLFPKAYQFTNLTTSLKTLGFNVVSTMHSVYEHLDKTVQEASVPNLIVHTDNAKNILVQKGISPEAVNVIPHGADVFSGTDDSPQPIEELFNTWFNDHVIFQPGFLFPYKGHLKMLEAIVKLKEKYPDIHYIIQASENPRNTAEHDALYEQILNYIKDNNILENVTINKGFVNQDVLISFIRTAKLCVLPYASTPGHDVYATSGMARLIMSTATPLVTSSAHLFDDLDGYVSKADTAEELCAAIDKVFSDWKIKKSQLDKRSEFLKNNNWKNIAGQTFNLYKKILNVK